MAKWIGLTGYAQSGKDFTFGLIRKLYPFANKVSFADPLKRILIAADPYVDSANTRLSDLLLKDSFESIKNKSPEIRRLLQRLGTEGCRSHLGEDVWIRAALKCHAESECMINVVTDIRFHNEARAVKEHGGKVVLVRRPGVKCCSTHPSETEIQTMQPDFVFENDGSEANIHNLLKFVDAYIRE